MPKKLEKKDMGKKKPSRDFGENNPPRIRKGKKPIGYTERPKTE